MIRRRIDATLIALQGAVGIQLTARLTSHPPVLPVTEQPADPAPIVAPARPARSAKKQQAAWRMKTPARAVGARNNVAPAPTTAGLQPMEPPRGGFRPTDEQTAIIDAARTLPPGGCLKVIAYAGAGKTSTMRLVAEQARPRDRALYMAFNRTIAADAKTSFPHWVEARTTHGVAFRALRIRDGEIVKHFGPQQVLRALPDGWLPTDGVEGIKRDQQARIVQAAIDLFCQSADPAPNGAQIDRVLDARVYRVPEDAPDPRDQELMLAHRLGMARRTAVHGLLERQVPRLWAMLADFRRHRVQISHDHYLKLFELDDDLVRQTFAAFRYLIVDEAQDLNPVQRSVAAKAGTSLVVVGDPWQQIYAWRGAEDALEHLPGDRRLHLSQSFRFGAAIADAAWRVLQSKPDGRPTVRLRGSAKVSRIVEAGGDHAAPVILGRTNAGVFTAAVKAAKRKLRVHVVGGIKDLSEELESAVALYEDRPGDVTHAPLRRFHSWAELRQEAEAAEDVALKRLVTEVEKGTAIRDLAVLRRYHIDAEAAAQVVVSTAHRAKGREWPHVALAEDWPSSEWLRRRYHDAIERQKPDEIRSALEAWHVLYVAVTRAIECLALPPDLYVWLA